MKRIIHSFMTDGKPDMQIQFINMPDFELFDDESEGIELMYTGVAARKFTICNKDFRKPWVIFCQHETIYYLNEVKLNGATDKESSICPIELVVNQDGNTSLRISNQDIPVTNDALQACTSYAEITIVRSRRAAVSILFIFYIRIDFFRDFS